MTIELSDQIKQSMFQAINDIGNNFPIDDIEINQLIKDVIEILEVN